MRLSDKACASDPRMAALLIDAIRREQVGGEYWSRTNDSWPHFATAKAVTLAGDDALALLAAIAGCPIHCMTPGPFAALSDLAPGTPDHDALVMRLVMDHLLAPVTWLDPFTGATASPLEIVAQMGRWRRLIEANSPISAAYGFAHWKRDTVAALLWGGDAPPPFAPSSSAHLAALPPSAPVAMWKARVPEAFLAEIERSAHPLIEVEDGFIRSIGLGAACVPPLSIVLDDRGAHYDPAHPSALELMIANGDPDAAALARAAALRARIAAAGISKYGIGGTALSRPAGDRHHILVVGQVEDDRSVLLGGGGLSSNRELLRRVRAMRPGAYIVYRPHPDVEAGLRKGRVPHGDALTLADAIDADSAISDLIAMVDEVHVLTSLAGFEALLHGKAVVTHGVPFYAGWGLTEDLGAIPARRGRTRSIDQLVSAVLIDYPRYLDPVSGLPCEVEQLVSRMGAGVRRQNRALVALRRGLGRINRLFTRLWTMHAT